MPSPIMPDQICRLTSVSEPSLSPDGNRLAFVKSRVDRETMGSRSQIMMMSLPGGAACEITAGPSDRAPRFSPDGGSLAFTRPDDDGRQQGRRR